jgi:hypothetical protein
LQRRKAKQGREEEAFLDMLLSGSGDGGTGEGEEGKVGSGDVSEVSLKGLVVQ